MTTLTLPSNASMDMYPGNTATEYVTQLANDISFENGKYEAALTEIIFSNDFYEPIHVNEENDYIGYSTSDSPSTINVFNFGLTGDYEDAYTALKKIEHANHTKMTVTKSGTGLISLIFKHNICLTPSIPNNLLNMVPEYSNLLLMGKFETEFTHFETMRIPGLPYVFLLRENNCKNNFVNHIYVFSDLIQPRETGGKLEPLLRSVAVKGESHRFQSVEYTKPYYFPLARNRFRNIKIWIRDKENRPVKFQKSPVIVKIKIRRIASAL